MVYVPERRDAPRDRHARLRSEDLLAGHLGGYRQVPFAHRELAATPAARLSQRVAIALSPAASAQPRTLSLAAVPTSEQFLNHADDRQRGYGNNPFGNFLSPKRRRRSRPAVPSRRPGPVRVQRLSANDLKTLAGSAVFNCNYGFKKHGFCNAIYQLSGGTLVAAGPLDFNASNFSLVITGGTGKYRSVARRGGGGDAECAHQRLAIALG